MKKQISRRSTLFLLASAAAQTASASYAASGENECESVSARNGWVADCLKRMLTVKPGMNRAQLMRVFTTEGGLSSARNRTFVSRDCPLFKVDVAFHREEGEDPRAVEELDSDVIESVSHPYLRFSVWD